MSARTTAPQPSQPTQAEQPQTRRDFLATAAAVTATQRLNSNISYNALDDSVQVSSTPRLNTCCTGECYTALIDCIRQAESGGENDEGCNAPPTGCDLVAIVVLSRLITKIISEIFVVELIQMV